MTYRPETTVFATYAQNLDGIMAQLDALRSDPEQWVRHDAKVSCYTGTDETGRPERVHELRSNGSCRCGKHAAREARS
jgi:hypothetical protein